MKKIETFKNMAEEFFAGVKLKKWVHITTKHFAEDEDYLEEDKEWHVEDEKIKCESLFCDGSKIAMFIPVHPDYHYFVDSDELFFGIIYSDNAYSMVITDRPTLDGDEDLEIEAAERLVISKVKTSGECYYLFTYLKDGKWGGIDNVGNYIISNEYDDITPASNYLIKDIAYEVVRSGKSKYYFDGKEYPSDKIFWAIQSWDQLDFELIEKFFRIEFNKSGVITEEALITFLMTKDFTLQELTKTETFLERIIEKDVYGENDCYNFHSHLTAFIEKSGSQLKMDNFTCFFIDELKYPIEFKSLDDLISFIDDITNEKFIIENYDKIYSFFDNESFFSKYF